MTPPEEWSPEALSLLDSLWGTQSTMLVIRRRLLPMLGFYPMPDQVMAMVNRTKEPSMPAVVPPRTVFEKGSVRRIEMFGFGPVPRQDNAVRLVTPKTFPADKFTMLGGKK